MKTGPILQKDQQIYLIAPMEKEEVLVSLEDIDDLKAPRCDGFNAYFFKKAWPIVGDEITEVILHFFKINWMYKTINCTTVTLVPKV